jgi:hypothetical protein
MVRCAICDEMFDEIGGDGHNILLCAAVVPGQQRKRMAAMEKVLACLLDHYLVAYYGSRDALAMEAEELVPNWKALSDEWRPKYPKK